MSVTELVSPLSCRISNAKVVRLSMNLTTETYYFSYAYGVLAMSLIFTITRLHESSPSA